MVGLVPRPIYENVIVNRLSIVVFDADRGWGRLRAGVGSTIYSGSAASRRRHEKRIQGSATIHPNVVGRKGRLQGRGRGHCWVPRPDRVELWSPGVSKMGFPRAPSAFAVASAVTPLRSKSGWGEGEGAKGRTPSVEPEPRSPPSRMTAAIARSRWARQATRRACPTEASQTSCTTNDATRQRSPSSSSPY